MIPGDDEHGYNLASLTFQVQDDGDTANGGVDLDPTPNVLKFNVTSVTTRGGAGRQLPVRRG